jgi:hypothetical protein
MQPAQTFSSHKLIPTQLLAKGVVKHDKRLILPLFVYYTDLIQTTG